MSDSQPSRSIFISYRRDDAGGEAGRLFDDLTRAFGPSTVFMDVAGIEPGTDFRKAIDENVASAGILLAVIGPQWLTIEDADGNHRLDDANDFVRLEIASALKRNIPVIPVLVHAATMPHADNLPDDLKDLAFRNAVELTLARWNSDVALLIPALKNYVHPATETATETVHAAVPVQLPAPESPATDRVLRSKRPWLAGGLIAAAALLIAAVLFFTLTASTVTRATTQYQVPLNFNITGVYSDGSTFDPRGGLDRLGHAYHPFVQMVDPATQNMTLHDGTVFHLGPADAPDAVRASLTHPLVVNLPPQGYSTLCLLAAAIDTPQHAQSFTVTYSGRFASTQQVTQDLSSWDTAADARFAGETTVLTQPYRNTAAGVRQPGRYALYQYQFKLDPAKNLKSLTLPQNDNVVILAATLVP
jgi:hypothetical protein